MTTALGFFSLTLTEFRAFTEFGLIAGMGILLTFISMYAVFPALVTVFERLGWKADEIGKSPLPKMESMPFVNPLERIRFVLISTGILARSFVITRPRTMIWVGVA